MNLVVQEAQEAPEVCQEDEEEDQDHQRVYILVVMESWSHLHLRFRVYSVEADVPSLASKVELGYRTNPHANWS